MLEFWAQGSSKGIVDPLCPWKHWHSSGSDSKSGWGTRRRGIVQQLLECVSLQKAEAKTLQRLGRNMERPTRSSSGQRKRNISVLITYVSSKLSKSVKSNEAPTCRARLNGRTDATSGREWMDRPELFQILNSPSCQQEVSCMTPPRNLGCPLDDSSLSEIASAFL